jgi:hypothetical protein
MLEPEVEDLASVEPTGEPHSDSWEPFLGSPAGIFLALVIGFAVVLAVKLLLGY